MCNQSIIMADLHILASRITEFGQNRRLMLFAAFLILSNNGALFSNSIYTQLMKTSLNYSQQTVSTIGFFSSLYVGIIPGLINDYSGAWLVLLGGAGLNVFGYLMIWLSITKRIARPHIWQMCLYHFLAGNAGSFINTPVLAVSVRNFPGSRGMVIGLLKGYLGLSGSLLPQMYFAIYGNNPSAYPLLAAWLPSSVFLLLMVFIRPIPWQHRAGQNSEETRNLYSLLVIAVALGAYMMAVNLVQNFETVCHIANEIIALIMVVLLFLPLIVVFRHDSSTSKSDMNQHQEETENLEYHESGNSDLPVQATEHMSDLHSALLSESTDPEPLTKSDYQTTRCSNLRSMFTELRIQPERGDNYTILQALVSLDFWIIFIALACGLGSGVMVVQNLGQIGNSLGYSQLHVATATALTNIWGFVGRVGFSFASEHFLQAKGVPRPLYFAVVLVISGMGHLAFAFNLVGCFYLGSMLVGMSFGAQWPLMSAMVSEIFGLKFFGTLYNVAIMAQSLGAYILSVRVAGYLYDQEAQKQDNLHTVPHRSVPAGVADSLQNSGLLCHGPQCFRLAFFIMAAVSLLAAILSFILAERTRAYYQKQALNRSHMKNSCQC